MVEEWDDLIALEVKKDDLNTKPKQNNLLIIDGNNLAFRYVGKHNYASFYDDYINTAYSLAKSYSAERVIICFDYGKSYYRNNILPTYKDSRKKELTEEEQERKEAFFNCLNDLINNYLDIEHYKFRGVEADDLITFFVDHLSEDYDHTWIVSSDKDLYQLLDEDVSIFNIFSRKEITVQSLLEDFECTPEEYLVAKIIMGDSGDTIPGVEGIGIKRGLGIAKKYKTIPNLIDSLPIAGKAKYIQNLNSSKDLLDLNENMINLFDYYEEAIKEGSEGETAWHTLLNACK